MSFKKRSSVWRRFVIPLLLGFVGVMTWLLITLPSLKDAPAPVTAQSTQEKASPSVPSKSSTKADPNKNVTYPKASRQSKILSLVHSEALRVGKLNLHPEQTYKDLEAKARSLPRGDLAILGAIAISPKFQNDLRFTSVFLLSLNKSKSSIPSLERVALAPISSEIPVNSPTYTEELVIRMQAIEGLRRFQSKGKKSGPLVDYIKRQNNPFLADHARRHL